MNVVFSVAQSHDAIGSVQPTGKRRKKGKPRTRWEDELNEFLSTQRGAEKGDWRLLAACREEWQKEEAAYRKACAEDDEEEEEDESW